MTDLAMRPQDIVIERDAGTLVITWMDNHTSKFTLRWLRSTCPCATCREERRKTVADSDVLTLSSGPLPSTAIASAELVGNYALRLHWMDGHETGIYAFNILRASCSCTQCHPEGPPEMLVGI